MIRIWTVVTCLLLLGSATSSPAASFALRRVADTTTGVPDGSGTFTGFALRAPSLANGRVAFLADGVGGQRGIYLEDGGVLSRIVDLTTLIPGGAGPFTGLEAPSLSGTDLVFRGEGPSLQGLYRASGGALEIVVDTSTAIPGGTGSFDGFFPRPALDGSQVAFRGTGSLGQAGVYRVTIGQAPIRIADKTTTIPGSAETFAGFIGQALDAGQVVFSGHGAAVVNGIYRGSGGVPSVVADASTAIPGGSGSFTQLGSSPDAGDGGIALRGLGLDQVGIYLDTGTGLERIVDQDTPAPGGSGTFMQLSAPNYAAGAVAFSGTDPSGSALYTDLGGTLSRVVAVGDSLDGRTILAMFVFRETLGAGQLALLALFTDGSEGIYLATLEPPIALLPGWALALLAALAGCLAALGGALRGSGSA